MKSYLVSALGMMGGTAAFGGVALEQALAQRILPERFNQVTQETLLKEVEMADRAADAAWLKLDSKAAYESYRLKMRAAFASAMSISSGSARIA